MISPPPSSPPKSPQAGLGTPFSPETPPRRQTRVRIPPTPQTPLRTAAIKKKYPNASELLLALIIDSIKEDECTSSDGIKQKLSELVDNVFEHDRETSRTLVQSTQPTLRVKETIVAQVPEFVNYLSKDYKKRGGSLGNSKDRSPKKKRKTNDGRLDPTSFSDEDDEDSEFMYSEGKSIE